MKKISAYFLGLTLTLAFASCSKDSPTPAAPTVSAKTALLTTPKWRISAIGASTTFGGQTTTTDGFTNQPSCRKDNFSKFDVSKSVTMDEGASRCSTNDPQSKQGTWSFNTAETELTVVDPSQPTGSVGHTIKAELLQLTSTTMQVRTTNSQMVNGFTIVSTATTTYTAF